MLPVRSVDIAPRNVPRRDVSPGQIVIAFGGSAAGAIEIPIRQLGEPLVECWDQRTGDLYLGSARAGESAPLALETRRLYARMIGEAKAAGYPWFLRMWNHVGSINEHDDGVERYQLFCEGRHEAFLEAGYHSGADLPAASAVGIPGRGIITYFLAAREPGIQIENPRQVAAYDYPPQYGVKSPSFSRATLWGDTLFVSGTSSVVGHESVHVGDLHRQIDETLHNIDVVIGRAFAGGGLDDVVTAKTYVRHPADYETISRRLDALFPSNLYLEADICRAELLLEIEVVCRVRR